MNIKEHFPNLPERISGLGRLAYNLWWSWNPSARQLFRMLDLQSWRESDHNPIRMLTLLPDEMLKKIAEDAAFLKRYDAIMECFEQQTTSGQGWFSDTFAGTDKTIAYFSAEYGLHSSLPLYAGGLGILAGDYIKECSDLGIPVVAMGLIYSRGYVWQRIAENGLQQDMEKTLDRIHDPILPVLDQDGNQLVVQVPIFDPPVHVAVWKAEVGRVTLYLMETDIDANQPWDRAIAHHLYATNPEQRLRQEIVLGMGGMRVLQTLGVQPSVVHINEGHPAFAALERMRSGIENRQSFDDALREIQETTVFTTHTPLPAGTDIFSFQLMEKYFSHYLDRLSIDSKRLLQLGTNPQDPGAGFNMTVFALRTSGYRNAVSERHGEVARKMWSGLWPEKQENEVPIQAITNGVHLSTWLEPLRFQPFLDKYLGNEWVSKQDQPGFWDKIDQIPDRELWQLHQDMKARLIDEINERARSRWQRDKISGSGIIALGGLLDSDILTLGFGRRFTGYKRPDLILHDIDRLKKLLTDPWHPIQIIFAGIAHPADQEGKRLIQKIFGLGQNPEYAGRIAFAEDYEQQLASYMVHGVDVWLNNPEPPLEASGTSGMKASVNGTPNLSILDGWWIEGYNEKNGWAFGSEEAQGDRTPRDAEALYTLLEKQIIPAFYERSDDEVPHDFVQVMKSAIKSTAPVFSSRRMAKEYVSNFYVPALNLKKNGK